MAGKGSADTRSDLADIESRSGGFTLPGGGDVDYNQIVREPQQQNQQQQNAVDQGAQQQQGSYYDEAAAQAAAAEAERQRRLEEERRRIAEENERQRRENDARNREAELERQQGTGSAQTQTASTAVTSGTRPSSDVQEAARSGSAAATMQPQQPALNIPESDLDPLFWDAVDATADLGYGSGAAIQRRLKIGYSRANHIIDQLEQAGIIAPPSNLSKPRDLLVDSNELKTMSRNYSNRGSNELVQKEPSQTNQQEQQRSDENIDRSSFESMTVKELKKLLKDRGLKVSGNKSELISRLLGSNSSSRVFNQQQTPNGQAQQQESSSRLHDIFANQQQTNQQVQQQEEQVENTYYNDQRQQEQPQQAQQPQQTEEEEQPIYQQVEDFIRRTSQQRISAAQRINDMERRAWLEANPQMSPEDYELSDEYWEDAEAFAHVMESMIQEQTMTLDNIQRDEFGDIIDPGTGITQKENIRQARLIQNVINAFRVGFFHITTERIETDADTGQQSLRWSAPVETRIIRLCDYFGMDPDALDSQRTVFRLVTLYSSMSIDRNGKMFKQDQDQWSLTENEFCKICDMIYMSCIERGHPLAPPWRTSMGESTLRGTDIIPSGVLPSVVARAITGENSRLRINGRQPSASELVEAVRQTWVTDTYPWIQQNLVNEPQRGKPRKDKDGNEIKPRNRAAQRVVIEDMQQALARIDSIDATAFSELWGVDTTPHYRIEEYRNTHKLYAEAMDDMYDSQAVSDYQDELLRQIEEDARNRKNSKEYSLVSAGANIITSGIRTNALFWNVPIMMSSVAEKGIGDVQTDWAIKSISRRTEKVTGASRMDVLQELRDAMKTDEARKAIDAALFLMEIEGPQALMLYAKKNPNTPLTPESAAAFVEKEYMPNAKNAAAETAREIQQKLSKFQQTILTGDIAFRDYDAKNFINAFLTCNQVLIGAQQQMMEQGIIDAHAGLALTGQEIDDAFTACNGDIALFIGDMMQLAAGRDALIMMRANNIGNFNPVGYAINRFLRNHGVSDALITTVIDSFPKYGINFLYSITPFSRSLSYLAMKRREAGGDMMASMLVMGGSFADVSNVETFSEAMQDPAFVAGLRMNLMYDAMTFGRWGITAMLLGGIMALLGFEPPDDPNDWQNVSRWRIGGQEIQWAYWLNDLTQLGLPLAYGFAATANGHGDKALQITLNSLYDQVDGNVVIDFAKGIKGWRDEMDELDKIATDPTYVSGWDPGYGMLELFLSAGDKITPGAPLYRYISTDTFIWGKNADQRTPYRVFDKSTDWAKEVGKTDYVTDAHERQMRKHCTSNWLLATYENVVHGTMPGQDSEGTGYYWWQMPGKKRQDDLVLTWAARQEMDFTNREDCKTDEEYKEHRCDDLIKMINEVSDEYGGLEQAVMHGFFIQHDIRYASLEVLSARAAEEEVVFQNKIDTGELVKYSDEFYTELADKKERVNEIWKYIKILQSKDVPMWNDGYTQILSDREVDYYHEDGTSASPWEFFFPVNGPVTVEYKNKGNHPWAMLPFTFVDKTSDELVKRGFSGETIPFWYTEGENGGTDLNAIMNGIGKDPIPSGVNAGKILNDVLFGAIPGSEQFLHPDTVTIDDRAWYPVKGYLSDDIANFDATERIKKLVEEADKDKDDDDKDKKKTTYPKSYGGSYKRRSGGGGGYDRNPKIYNSRVSVDRITGSKISSTRTSPDSRSVNADKAATMYSKQPQSTKINTYLRPSFSTKGSREAYKRQDI